VALARGTSEEHRGANVCGCDLDGCWLLTGCVLVPWGPCCGWVLTRVINRVRHAACDVTMSCYMDIL
jgi:hypothetical protein